MSERIDVLMVMGNEVATLRRLETWVNEALAPCKANADDAIQSMLDARAAVAELIEAGEAYHDAMLPGVDIRARVAAGRRFDAALGRVKGGDA